MAPHSDGPPPIAAYWYGLGQMASQKPILDRLSFTICVYLPALAEIGHSCRIDRPGLKGCYCYIRLSKQPSLDKGSRRRESRPLVQITLLSLFFFSPHLQQRQSKAKQRSIMSCPGGAGGFRDGVHPTAAANEQVVGSFLEVQVPEGSARYRHGWVSVCLPSAGRKDKGGLRDGSQLLDGYPDAP